MASYNNGRYLGQAIESVIAQSYPHWELVIVEDGSTDDSVRVCRSFLCDARINLYRNDRNMGCGFTKKRCVDLSRGELCGFLDPDDELAPMAVEVMVAAHRRHAGASLVYSTHWTCDERMRPIEVPPWVRQIPHGASSLTSAEYISHFATFPRARYLETEGIDPSFVRAVDKDLYYKLEETGPVVHVEKALYFRRKHAGGISTFGNTAKARWWDLVAKEGAYRRRCVRGFPRHLNTSRKRLCQEWFEHYRSQVEQAARRGSRLRALVMAVRALVHARWPREATLFLQAWPIAQQVLRIVRERWARSDD